MDMATAIPAWPWESSGRCTAALSQSTRSGQVGVTWPGHVPSLQLNSTLLWCSRGVERATIYSIYSEAALSLTLSHSLTPLSSHGRPTRERDWEAGREQRWKENRGPRRLSWELGDNLANSQDLGRPGSPMIMLPGYTANKYNNSCWAVISGTHQNPMTTKTRFMCAWKGGESENINSHSHSVEFSYSVGIVSMQHQNEIRVSYKIVVASRNVWFNLRAELQLDQLNSCTASVWQHSNRP